MALGGGFLTADGAEAAGVEDNARDAGVAVRERGDTGGGGIVEVVLLCYSRVIECCFSFSFSYFFGVGRI